MKLLSHVSIIGILVSTLTFCSRNPTEPQIQELLLNGSIEGGLHDPAYWSCYASEYEAVDEYIFTWEDTLYHSPSRALSIRRDNILNTTCFACWYQRIPIEPGALAGRTLELSCHLKLSAIQGPGVSLVMRADLPSGELAGFATTQGEIDISGWENWTPYSLEMRDLDPEADQVCIYLLMGNNTTGKVYFDDVSLIARN